MQKNTHSHSVPVLIGLHPSTKRHSEGRIWPWKTQVVGTENFRGFGNRSTKEGVATNPLYRAERTVQEESVDVNSH